MTKIKLSISPSSDFDFMHLRPLGGELEVIILPFSIFALYWFQLNLVLSKCMSWNLRFNVKFKPSQTGMSLFNNLNTLDVESSGIPLSQLIECFHQSDTRGILGRPVELKVSNGSLAPDSDYGGDEVSEDALRNFVEVVRDLHFEDFIEEFNGEATESDRVVNSFA